MQMAGIQPVIAHPERNSQIMEQPDKLFHLVEKGAISQLTAASVTGDLGKNTKIHFSINRGQSCACNSNGCSQYDNKTI